MLSRWPTLHEAAGRSTVRCWFNDFFHTGVATTSPPFVAVARMFRKFESLKHYQELTWGQVSSMQKPLTCLLASASALQLLLRGDPVDGLGDVKPWFSDNAMGCGNERSTFGREPDPSPS